MKLLQYAHPNHPSGQIRRVGLLQKEEVIDLTACPPHPASIYDIYYHLGGNRLGLEESINSLDRERAPRLGSDQLLQNITNLEQPHLLSPITAPKDSPQNLRVWLAGVTHADSAKLREIEAKQATGDSVNVYEQKYRECAQGGIPELFSKSDSDLVSHGGTISRPPSTVRLVPETELVTVYGLNQKGQVERLGYTGGNDFTDNGIEAANPLNLPQAKNWSDGCASLGPLVVTASEFDDCNLTVSCEIIREGNRVAHKQGLTGQENLNMPNRLLHLERSLFTRLPLQRNVLQVLYWGTPIVFSNEDLRDGLQEGDIVRMSFEGLGVLENRIATFPKVDQLRGLEERAS